MSAAEKITPITHVAQFQKFFLENSLPNIQTEVKTNPIKNE